MYKVFLVTQMMKLTLGSNKVLRYMHIHTYAYLRVGIKRLKLFKDGLNLFLLGVIPRILP